MKPNKNRILEVIGTIISGLFMLFIIILYNVMNPVFGMGDLTTSFWCGYYEMGIEGKSWILVSFNKDDTHTLMTLISNKGKTTYELKERNSSDGNFISYKFKNTNSTVEAKQLYRGKRYIFERLFVGRFNDFWEINTDDSIRGTINISDTKSEFAIERLKDDEVIPFLQQVVGINTYSSIQELKAL